MLEALPAFAERCTSPDPHALDSTYRTTEPRQPRKERPLPGGTRADGRAGFLQSEPPNGGTSDGRAFHHARWADHLCPALRRLRAPLWMQRPGHQGAPLPGVRGRGRRGAFAGTASDAFWLSDLPSVSSRSKEGLIHYSAEGKVTSAAKAGFVNTSLMARLKPCPSRIWKQPLETTQSFHKGLRLLRARATRRTFPALAEGGGAEWTAPKESFFGRVRL